MKQTWRWFGPKDLISIQQLLQVGVEGVVTALYDIPPGTVWPLDAIKQRQLEIEKLDDSSLSGLTWDVVESLPVSEAIKTRSGDFRDHISAYKHSLKNLAEAGLKTVCYNFMPVLDWTRTSLRAPQSHGGYAMEFDIVDFAVFDLHLLKRKNASASYPLELIDKAERRFANMDASLQQHLANNIVAGLPGANDNWTLGQVRELLETYSEIDPSKLKQNFVAFLENIAPLASQLGINICCHPDDPPFPLLGLPRIVSSETDYAFLMKAVDLPENGITLCTGSLGVSPEFDFVDFIKTWGHRIHFAHLRNTSRQAPTSPPMYSFHEAEHLGGDTDMVSVIKALLLEEANRKKTGRMDWQIPMRPDHGQEILGDIGRNSMPGYPLIGRTKGLAELRGIMQALSHS